MVSKATRTKRNRTRRLLDEQEGLCYYCDKPFGDNRKRKPTQEHLKRVVNGGTAARSNIVLACTPCNSGREAHPPEYWKYNKYRKAILKMRNVRSTERRRLKKLYNFRYYLNKYKFYFLARFMYRSYHTNVSRYYLTKEFFVAMVMKIKYRKIVKD